MWRRASRLTYIRRTTPRRRAWSARGRGAGLPSRQYCYSTTVRSSPRWSSRIAARGRGIRLLRAPRPGRPLAGTTTGYCACTTLRLGLPAPSPPRRLGPGPGPLFPFFPSVVLLLLRSFHVGDLSWVDVAHLAPLLPNLHARRFCRQRGRITIALPLRPTSACTSEVCIVCWARPVGAMSTRSSPREL